MLIYDALEELVSDGKLQILTEHTEIESLEKHNSEGASSKDQQHTAVEVYVMPIVWLLGDWEDEDYLYEDEGICWTDGSAENACE